MKKLLITGASGFLGWHLCQQAQAQQARSNWEIYGTFHSRPANILGVRWVAIDLTDFSALQQLFATVQPDAVIHAAAQSSPNLCQIEPEASYRINVTASWNIAGLCADAAIPCAFTSSEQVFDGLKPPYRETDPVCPINVYGTQKAAAEAGMLDRHPNAVICRMPLMFGIVPTASSFIQGWIETIRAGRSLNLFVDEIRTPISGTTAAKGILLALERATGRLHLGGRETISRYDFGRLMVEVLQLPDAKLNPCYQADMKMAAPRPADASLDSSIAFSLGYQPGTVRQELESVLPML